MSTPIHTVGTIATDPRHIQTQSGISLCTFRLACSERRYDREQSQWVDGDTNWFTVSAFRGLADHAHASFHKGDRVIVSGRLRVRAWEQGEKSGTAVDIDADALGHDLRWGVSAFTKQSATAADQAPDAGRTQPGDALATERESSPAAGGWGAPPASEADEHPGTTDDGEKNTGRQDPRGSGHGFLPAVA